MRGLAEAGAWIVVFSRHSRDSRWLTYARIEEQKMLIPALLGGFVPPLLGSLAHLPIRSRP
jgi:hypothetical protein